MNTKEIFDNYLTNQYSNTEKIDFSDKNQLRILFEKNGRDIRRNLRNFF